MGGTRLILAVVAVAATPSLSDVLHALPVGLPDGLAAAGVLVPGVDIADAGVKPVLSGSPRQGHPPALEAVADHGEVTGDTITGSYAEASTVLEDLDGQGVSYAEVVQLLEDEGVEKFKNAWAQLYISVEHETRQLR